MSKLKTFLGLVNYYGKFLPDLSTLLSLLITLLQATMDLGEESEDGISRHEGFAPGEPMLVHFDDSLPLVLPCDASPHRLRAVLSNQIKCQMAPRNQ